MAYDKNECRFSGTVSDIREIKTRTGTKMTSFKLQCWKESIRCVGFREIAELIQNFNDGDRVEIAGNIQSSNWAKEGLKVYSYQLIVDSIDSESQGQDPQAKVQQHSQQQSLPDQPSGEQDPVRYDYAGGPF